MRTKRILCVEDHQDTCELISVFLVQYQVVSAYNIYDAISLAKHKNFDLYLIDYHLADGTGIELCSIIKNFDTKTPILFITGSSSITESQILKIGAQGLVKKGKFSFLEDLESIVKKLI